MFKLCPPKPNTKSQKIGWLNFIVHAHDLQCECDRPLEHTTWMIFEQERNLRFSTQEKQQLQQWLTSTETTTDHTTKEEDDVFGDGVLDALFAGDFGEEDTTKDTTTESG